MRRRSAEKCGLVFSSSRRAAIGRAAARWAAERLEPRTFLASDGQVVVSEVMYHAGSQNPADEWVELYNKGSTPVNLAGWQFSKGINYAFSATTLSAGQYLVLARDIARFQSQHPGVTNVVGGWSSGQLGNNGDTLRMVDAGGACRCLMWRVPASAWMNSGARHGHADQELPAGRHPGVGR